MIIKCVEWDVKLVNEHAALTLHIHFHLVYSIFAIAIVIHCLCSLMAFDCHEIKELLVYLLTYLLKYNPGLTVKKT